MNINEPGRPGQTDHPRAPYYYLYGRKHHYGTASPLQADGQMHRAGSAPFFFAEESHSLDEKPQTVEDLIDHGYFAVPNREPEMAMLHDRRDTAWLGLDDILNQARQRQEIYQQNLLDVLWSECYAFNELARSGWPATAEEYALYERRRQELRAERRGERISLWRDLARLRERIPESAQNYLSALRKLDLLADTDTDGDLP